MSEQEQPRYTVFVDDNFHYMDEEHRYKLGEFETCEAAIAACKAIVDEFLQSSFKPGMKAEDLWVAYHTFGEDPFVLSDDPLCKFSAWDYAEGRCHKICP